MLKPGGRAAVVIPDNVLFEAGAAAAIRRRLLETCRVHTLLRLPPGLFYAQGVKANVLFFNRPVAARKKSASDLIWAYDLRSDKRFSLKTKPLQREDLEEFVALFRSGFRSDTTMPSSVRQAGGRFRSFDAAQLLATTECRLDVAWEDESTQARTPGLARLNEISRLVAEDLQRALDLLGKRPS
jgi:type I restriction enzyme M protein